jgi:hypothetical protein
VRHHQIAVSVDHPVAIGLLQVKAGATIQELLAALSYSDQYDRLALTVLLEIAAQDALLFGGCRPNLFRRGVDWQDIAPRHLWRGSCGTIILGHVLSRPFRAA